MVKVFYSAQSYLQRGVQLRIGHKVSKWHCLSSNFITALKPNNQRIWLTKGFTSLWTSSWYCPVVQVWFEFFKRKSVASRILGFDLFPAMSINSLRKSPCALKTWHNSLTFSVLDLKSKYLAAIPLFFPKLATETYGMLLSWRTNLMSRRSMYDCFSDSNQNGYHTFTQKKNTKKWKYN